MPIFDEMEKQVVRDWYSFHYEFRHNPPCIPFCLTVKGAVPRASEPLRPRPTADGGRGDRKDIFDSNGFQVRSINTMCGLPEMPLPAALMDGGKVTGVMQAVPLVTRMGPSSGRRKLSRGTAT